MSWGMYDFHRILSDRYRFSVLEKLIYLGRWQDAEIHELLDTALHGLEHREIVMMDQKWNLELGANCIHAEYMIEVSMSGNDLVRFDCEVT